MAKATRSTLITRIHGWVSDNMVRQRFKQINEFEELIHESGTTILSSFCTSRRKNRKDGLVGPHKGGATVTPFLHFLYEAMVVETILLQRRIELSRFGHHGSLFSEIASLVFGAFAVTVCFMLNESMQGK